VTLLEFWFVNCGACRQAVPHMNKLLRQYMPKGLQAYAVTFDRPEAVKEYLKEVPLAAPVGIDRAMATIKPYGVFAYPTTVLIGKAGKVLSCSSPMAIDEQVLNDALAGRPVKVKEKELGAIPAPEMPLASAPAFASVRITPISQASGVSFDITPSKVVFKGIPLRYALQNLYGLDLNQSKIELLPDERIFNFEAEVEGGKGDAALALLRSAVEKVFRLTITVEQREMDVAVFRKSGPLKGVRPWNGKDRTATKDQYKGMPLTSIINSAAFMMKIVGIDETGDTNFYDFTLTFETGKPIEQQIKENFGLEVTREKRKLPFTTIKQSS
jgi:uncharacterized protein (TIGR03435 family)